MSPLHPPLYLLIGLTQISIVTLNEKQGEPKPLPLSWPCHCFPDQNIWCFQVISTLKLGFMVMVSIFLNCSYRTFTHIDHNIDLPDRCLGLPSQCVGLPGRCHGKSSFESLTDRQRYFTLPAAIFDLNLPFLAGKKEPNICRDMKYNS